MQWPDDPRPDDLRRGRGGEKISEKRGLGWPEAASFLGVLAFLAFHSWLAFG